MCFPSEDLCWREAAAGEIHGEDKKKEKKRPTTKGTGGFIWRRSKGWDGRIKTRLVGGGGNTHFKKWDGKNELLEERFDFR